MPELARNPITVPIREARHGIVTKAPSAVGEPFEAVVPEFNDEDALDPQVGGMHVFEIRRWQSRGATLPAVGDEVLVVVDDNAEPWGAAWWPAAGDAVSVPILASLLDAKGDLIAATADNTPARLAVGSNFARLVADSGSAAGVKWGSKDYGIVEALPTSPTPAVGDRCVYVADKTAGVLWGLIYDGEGSKPWKKIGGPPLVKEVTTDESTASTTYTSTGFTAQTLTTPFLGDYHLGVEANIYHSAAAIAEGYMSAEIGASAAVDEIACAKGSSNQVVSTSVERRTVREIGASKTITAKYRTSSGTAHFRWRRLTLDPVRVG